MMSIVKLIQDETGAEVTELGLILALIVAGSTVTLALIGPKLQAAYTSVNGSLP